MGKVGTTHYKTQQVVNCLHIMVHTKNLRLGLVYGVSALVDLTSDLLLYLEEIETGQSLKRGSPSAPAYRRMPVVHYVVETWLLISNCIPDHSVSLDLINMACDCVANHLILINCQSEQSDTLI